MDAAPVRARVRPPRPGADRDLPGVRNLRYEAPTEAAELQASRRLELQASCFSDIFISANKGSYPISGESLRQWKWLIGNTTDHKRDHGNKDNHKYWALQGYNARKPGACNTFTASGAKVS